MLHDKSTECLSQVFFFFLLNFCLINNSTVEVLYIFLLEVKYYLKLTTTRSLHTLKSNLTPAETSDMMGEFSIHSNKDLLLLYCLFPVELTHSRVDSIDTDQK